MLQVSRSGYYAWKTRPVSLQTLHRTELISEIHVIHANREMHVDGSPRVYRELLTHAYQVGENTVAKLMSSEGIASSTAKRFRASTTDSKHSLAVAENILDRDFTADCCGQEAVESASVIRPLPEEASPNGGAAYESKLSCRS